MLPLKPEANDASPGSQVWEASRNGSEPGDSQSSVAAEAPPPAAATAPATSRRYLLVDALRGFAALAVVVFHLWHKNLGQELGLSLPGPLESIVGFGDLGVAVFFVLSGFVIAHSVFGARITPSFFGKFVLRRSLRLDPPYWASLVLAIGSIAVLGMLRPSSDSEIPSPNAVLAHLFYLQRLLGYKDIVGVYWTLCYEVQFYLVFVLLQGVAQYLSRESVPTRVNFPYAVVFLLTWVLSLLCATDYLQSPEGLFIDRWFQFFAGVAAYWAYRGFIPRWVLAGVLLGTAASGFDPHGRCVTTLIVATLLYIASQTGHLWTASCGSFVQTLGRVSYSLYLTHMLVGSRIVRFSAERFPHMGLGAAVLMLFVGTAASIVFAMAMYRVIERPSLRLAGRVRY